MYYLCTLIIPPLVEASIVLLPPAIVNWSGSQAIYTIICRLVTHTCLQTRLCASLHSNYFSFYKVTHNISRQPNPKGDLINLCV